MKFFGDTCFCCIREKNQGWLRDMCLRMILLTKLWPCAQTCKHIHNQYCHQMAYLKDAWNQCQCWLVFSCILCPDCVLYMTSITNQACLWPDHGCCSNFCLPVPDLNFDTTVYTTLPHCSPAADLDYSHDHAFDFALCYHWVPTLTVSSICSNHCCVPATSSLGAVISSTSCTWVTWVTFKIPV